MPVCANLLPNSVAGKLVTGIHDGVTIEGKFYALAGESPETSNGHTNTEQVNLREVATYFETRNFAVIK